MSSITDTAVIHPAYRTGQAVTCHRWGTWVVRSVVCEENGPQYILQREDVYDPASHPGEGLRLAEADLAGAGRARAMVTT